MDYSRKIQTLLQIQKRKWLFMVGLVALTHMFCQSLVLPYGNALLSLLHDSKNNEIVKVSESPNQSSIKAAIVDDPQKVGTSNFGDESPLVPEEKSKNSYVLGGDVEDDEGPMEKEKEKGIIIKSDFEGNDLDNDFDFVEDETLDHVNVDMEEGFVMQNDRGQEHGSLLPIGAGESRPSFPHTGFIKESSGNMKIHADPRKIQDTTTNGDSVTLSSVVVSPAMASTNSVVLENAKSDTRISNDSVLEVWSERTKELPMFNNGSAVASKPVKKKMRCEMPPKTVMTIDEMQRLVVRHRARSRAMRPRWSSERDQEILAAKFKIENAPTLKNDQELYAPLFRNISMFKRSYELMIRVLKIYVYKEGEKPIFHQPVLKGLYASEGWFMKLMEGNKNFIVKDPRKAHLFYMPFSSRMLEYTLYVRNSHNRTNLRQYLKNYSEKIAAKYRFWNRTDGADHFLVACHDWAPYETRHHMEQCIKALCNADVTMGFKIGRDVSFPETYVRSARNPLRDLGGKPPSQRNILAFYAGNMHGYLRPILLEYWRDKDPSMKILGPMPPGVTSKMNYIQYMKSSKFCICPKGYEVNSPRVVEAIFYECVPVIISDNFVPPFFEVLNWDAFSVIIAEKDIPNLKNILLSIPEQKYLDMQLGVQRIQKHFLWHAKPLKYDLFHMTLHSIWYNRVFQTRLR